MHSEGRQGVGSSSLIFLGISYVTLSLFPYDFVISQNELVRGLYPPAGMAGSWPVKLQR